MVGIRISRNRALMAPVNDGFDTIYANADEGRERVLTRRRGESVGNESHSVSALISEICGELPCPIPVLELASGSDW